MGVPLRCAWVGLSLVACGAIRSIPHASTTPAVHRFFVSQCAEDAARMRHITSQHTYSIYFAENGPEPRASKNKNGPLHLRSIQPSMRSMENAHF